MDSNTGQKNKEVLRRLFINDVLLTMVTPAGVEPAIFRMRT